MTFFDPSMYSAKKSPARLWQKYNFFWRDATLSLKTLQVSHSSDIRSFVSIRKTCVTSHFEWFYFSNKFLGLSGAFLRHVIEPLFSDNFIPYRLKNNLHKIISPNSEVMICIQFAQNTLVS